MKELMFPLIAILVQVSVNVALPLSGNYSILRSQILAYERRMTIGANLTLTDLEEIVNGILMRAKKKELDLGSFL